MDLFRSREFSVYTQKLLKRHNVPGVAIGIVQGGKMASVAFGKASLDTPKNFATDSIFCVGSAAKSLTAASVAMLVADNAKYPQVQFDAPMSSLLPDDFVMPGEDHDDVTVEEILSHRTGMASHEHSILGPRAKRLDDARSIMRNLRNLRNLSCIAPNRSEHIYCNMMYTAITYLIEHFSGMSFSNFLESKIFNPLEMRSTYLFLDRVRSQGQSHRVATGYSRHKSELRETHCSDGPESQGAGQIWSTVDDYLKWIQAMLQFKGPITENIVKAVTTKRIRQDPDEDEGEANLDTWYALGWQVHEYGGHEIVSHEGREPGYQCNQFFLHDFNFGGVIFCNSDDADTTVSRLMYKLIDEVAHAGSSGASHDDDDDDESEAGSVSGSDSDAEADNEEYEEELRQELSPGIGKPQPQTLPLSAYTRQYWHPGYHRLKHICDQTKYIGYMAQSFEPLDMPIKAEFRLENHRAVRLGIHLEARIDDYIWFDKLER